MKIRVSRPLHKRIFNEVRRRKLAEDRYIIAEEVIRDALDKAGVPDVD